MARTWITLVLVLFSAVSQAQAVAEKPERAVILIIDGLHWQAPERLGLRNFKELAAQGTSFRQVYCIAPYHPTTGAWASVHTCSIPNPVLAAGTLFLKPDHLMIQHVFYPDQKTAHVVNSLSYVTMDRGFSFSMMVPPTTPDSVPIREAIRLLKNEDIRFMRLHLQNTGNAGNQCAETEEDVPWRHDIWADGSPYIAAAHNADRLLGEFVNALKAMNKWDQTILVVTADHGQSNSGWHPLLPEDSWITPLVFVGPGVAKNRKIPYAEHIDIVPTVCSLMGVQPPNVGPGSGRVLEEVKAKQRLKKKQRPQYLKELNQVLKEYRLLSAEMIIHAKKNPVLENVALRAEREFYGLERILEWRELGSVLALIQQNRSVVGRMRKALGQIGAGQAIGPGL